MKTYGRTFSRHVYAVSSNSTSTPRFRAAGSTSRWRGFVCAGLAAFALAGCESSANIFGPGVASAPETSVAQPQPAPQPARPRVAIAPVIGAPDTVARQLAQDMSSALAQSNIDVVSPTDGVLHTLRGYVVAARDRNGVKVSYIWDVTDPQGGRANRFTGEEIVRGGDGRDPWAAVSPQVSQAIAQRISPGLVNWLGTQVPAGQPIAGNPPPSAPLQASNPQFTPGSQTSTASIPTAAPGPTLAMVPQLVGAPGDGNRALSEALKAQLARNGIATTNQPVGSHRVEGVVMLTPAASGKQTIQIDWHVKDPGGNRLGTVTQKNEIPEGSLNGQWGQTADAAAEAAASGILKLLPAAGPARPVTN